MSCTSRESLRTLTPFSAPEVPEFSWRSCILTICVDPDAGIQRPYGVRITLKPGDPFRKLLGADWNKTHWFGSAAERDAALIEMARKHEYSRPGDQPALKFDKVEKLHESRGL